MLNAANNTLFTAALSLLIATACAQESATPPPAPPVSTTPAPAPKPASSTSSDSTSSSRSTSSRRSPSSWRDLANQQTELDEEQSFGKFRRETAQGLLMLARHASAISEAQSTTETTTEAGKSVTVAEAEDVCDASILPPEKFKIPKALPPIDPCRDRGTMIVADTDTGVLSLCQESRRVRAYDFAKGRGGVGKEKEGDRKTPLGIYPLSEPEASRNGFKIVIKIGFPTDEQKELGLTGSNIAIHGPPREYRCAGYLNTNSNWTDGCLAVSSDLEIKEIGRFIEQFHVKEIAILPLPAAR